MAIGKLIYLRLILLCCLLISFATLAQDKPKIDDKLSELTVDRPGIAETPFTVSPGMYQLETGFDYYKRPDGEIYFLPVSLFRVGLSKAAELRITAKHILDKSTANNVQGISPLTVGIKTHIIEQRGWIPETDILADIIIPLGNSDLQPTGLGHDILLLFQNDISSKFAINYNIGVIWDGFTDKDTFTASACFNYLPTERLGLFLEYYDFLRRKGIKEHGIDGGLTYLITPHVQADLSAGISVSDSNLNHFISSGISIRID